MYNKNTSLPVNTKMNMKNIKKRDGPIINLKSKFDKVDVLLVDDIQFLA